MYNSLDFFVLLNHKQKVELFWTCEFLWQSTLNITSSCELSTPYVTPWFSSQSYPYANLLSSHRLSPQRLLFHRCLLSAHSGKMFEWGKTKYATKLQSNIQSAKSQMGLKKHTVIVISVDYITYAWHIYCNVWYVFRNLCRNVTLIRQYKQTPLEKSGAHDVQQDHGWV